MITNDGGDFFLQALDEEESKTEQHFNFAQQMPSLFFYAIKFQSVSPTFFFSSSEWPLGTFYCQEVVASIKMKSGDKNIRGFCL